MTEKTPKEETRGSDGTLKIVWWSWAPVGDFTLAYNEVWRSQRQQLSKKSEIPLKTVSVSAWCKGAKILPAQICTSTVSLGDWLPYPHITSERKRSTHEIWNINIYKNRQKWKKHVGIIEWNASQYGEYCGEKKAENKKLRKERETDLKRGL